MLDTQASEGMEMTRGSTAAAPNRGSRYADLQSDLSTGDDPLAGANPQLLYDCICAVCVTGDAITFGYTRDGGTCLITILEAGTPHKAGYVRGAPAVDALLTRIMETALS